MREQSGTGAAREWFRATDFQSDQIRSSCKTKPGSTGSPLTVRGSLGVCGFLSGDDKPRRTASHWINEPPQPYATLDELVHLVTQGLE